jgi:heat shock protein HslJ
MGTQHSALPLLALAGVMLMLAGCEKRPQSTPQTSTPTTAGATPDSGTAPTAAVAADSDSTSSMDVKDTTWQWVRLTTPAEQLDVDAPDRYTLRFGSDGRVALRADCNRGTGAYSMSADRKLALKPVALGSPRRSAGRRATS